MNDLHVHEIIMFDYMWFLPSSVSSVRKGYIVTRAFTGIEQSCMVGRGTEARNIVETFCTI